MPIFLQRQNKHPPRACGVILKWFAEIQPARQPPHRPSQPRTVSSLPERCERYIASMTATALSPSSAPAPT
eukprot:scaffold7329_cov58-Phaeocystis_antarctica.AAC.1